MRQTERAIISSSSVRMMRTVTRPVCAEITGAFSAFLASFTSMPRKPSPSQMRVRMVGVFSPMPPAKTSVSNPPSAAAKAPIRFRAGDRFEFLHQKRIGQPVKAVSLNALGLVAARNRKQLRHARQCAVKRRVETGDLRYLGKLRGKHFHQRDGGREMVRGKRTDAPKFLKHGLIHAERIAITRTAMHNTMADGADRLDAVCFLQQLNQQRNASNVVGCINHALVALVREDVRKCQF